MYYLFWKQNCKLNHLLMEFLNSILYGLHDVAVILWVFMVFMYLGLFACAWYLKVSYIDRYDKYTDSRALKWMFNSMLSVSAVLFIIGTFKHYVFDDWTVADTFIGPAWILLLLGFGSIVLFGIVLAHAALRLKLK